MDRPQYLPYKFDIVRMSESIQFWWSLIMVVHVVTPPPQYRYIYHRHKYASSLSKFISYWNLLVSLFHFDFKEKTSRMRKKERTNERTREKERKKERRGEESWHGIFNYIAEDGAFDKMRIFRYNL